MNKMSRQVNFDATVMSMDEAHLLLENGPSVMHAAKDVLVTSNGRLLEEAFAIESRAAAAVMRSEDAREGPLPLSPALTIGGGTSVVQRNILPERVLGLPDDIDVEQGMTWSETRQRSAA